MSTPKTHTEMAETAIALMDAHTAEQRTLPDQEGLNARFSHLIMTAYIRAVAAALDGGTPLDDIFKAVQSSLGNALASFLASYVKPEDFRRAAIEAAMFIQIKAITVARDDAAPGVQVTSDGQTTITGMALS